MSNPSSRLAAELKVVGDVSGETDLVIEGVLEGNVVLPNHALRVAASGSLLGDAQAREVYVDGAVRGNLKAGGKVSIGGSARVEGHVTAPRIQLEDGAQLDGSVTMVVNQRADPADTVRVAAPPQIAPPLLQPVAGS